MQIRNVRDIAREIRSTRKRYMLRQGEVARAVGVSRQWICALERGGKSSLDLGLVLRTFDELGLDLTATRREPPPQWTVPLTMDAEFREKRSIYRMRRQRMEARDRRWAIAQGNREPGPDDPKLDDDAYVEMIREARAMKRKR